MVASAIRKVMAGGILLLVLAPASASRDRDGCGARQLALVVLLWYYCRMKVAVSIPDDVFESGEQVSKRLGVSRSRLYATALAEYVAKNRGRKVTERLNVIYGAVDSRLPAAVKRLQAKSLTPEPW